LVAFFIILFNVCKPFPSFWLQADYFWLAANENNFKCMNEGVILVSSAAISAVQDFVACGLPIILFWKLQIPKRQKIALGGIFALGFFLCICSILRVLYIFRTYYDTYDMTWESRPAWMWLVIEADVAVICASAPALKIFFKHTVLGSRTNKSLRRPSYVKPGELSSGDSDPSSVEKGVGKRIGKTDTWDISFDSKHSDHELVSYESKVHPTFAPNYYRPPFRD